MNRLIAAYAMVITVGIGASLGASPAVTNLNARGKPTHAVSGWVAKASRSRMHYGMPAVIGPLGIHEMLMPVPPKGWPNRGLFGFSYAAVFLRDADVVDEGSNIAVRYDPARHRFLHGYVGVGSDSGVVAAGAGQNVWEWGGNMCEISVALMGFGWSEDRIKTYRGFWNPGQSNGLVVNRRGDTWIAGWKVASRYWGDWNCTGNRKHSADGLPLLTPRGRAAIFVQGPNGSRGVIRAPASGPLTGIAMSGRYLWALDPFTRCLSSAGGWRCRRPRFLRYDVSTDRFKVFTIPASIRLKPVADLYYDTPMASAPDGSVWALVRSGPFSDARHQDKQAFTLLGLVHGAFVEHRLWWAYHPCAYGCSPDIMIDGQGRIWLTGRNFEPWAVDPRTWVVTKIPLHAGTLLEDSHRTIWYILGPT
jgi:hypothetical protein